MLRRWGSSSTIVPPPLAITKVWPDKNIGVRQYLGDVKIPVRPSKMGVAAAGFGFGFGFGRGALPSAPGAALELVASSASASS